jgi:PhnB protein
MPFAKIHWRKCCYITYLHRRCDKAFNQAVAAGANVTMPLMDMFWGDRYGQIEDPFGHFWSLATHKQDLTPEQVGKAGADMLKRMMSAKD